MMTRDAQTPRDRRLLWVLANELDDDLWVAFTRMRLFEELDEITSWRKMKKTDNDPF